MKIIKSKSFEMLTISVAIFLFFILQEYLDWPLLRISHFRGGSDFADLRAVLHNVDCYHHIGNAIYESASGDGCRNYIYGSTLIQILAFFHLGSQNAHALAMGLWTLLSIAISILFLTISGKKSKLIFLVTVVISPPMQLLVERANFDILIFLLVFASAYFLNSKRTSLSLIALGLASAIKFYTLPLFAIILSKAKRFTILLTAIPTVALIYRIKCDFGLLNSIDVHTFISAFGLPIWGLYLEKLGFDVPNIAAYFLGISILVLFALQLYKSNYLGRLPNTLLLKDLVAPNLLTRFSAMSTFVFLSCFLVGMNYDYRLILLAIATNYFLHSSDLSSKHKKRRVIILLIAVWFSFETTFLQPIGDVAVFIIVADYLIALGSELMLSFKRIKSQVTIKTL